MLHWFAGLFSRESRAETSRSIALDVITARLKHESAERVLQELARELNHVAVEDSRPGPWTRMVPALDEYAQGAVAEVRASLFVGASERDVSERAWSVLVTYYQAASGAYCRYISQLTWQGMSETAYGGAAVAVARAIYATAAYVLLRHFRYRAASRNVWKQLGQLAKLAGVNGFLHAELELYPGDGGRTTVERELLIALLTETAPASNLLPVQIGALALLLRLHSSEFRLAPSYDERGTPFAWEPLQGEPPQRWSQNLPVLPELQFFGLGSAYSQICMEREKARSGDCPQWVASTGCISGDYLDLLDRLVAAWSLQPPVRREQRSAKSGELLVAHDWSAMVRLIRFSELARTGERHGYDSSYVYGIHSAPRAPSDRTFNYSQVLPEMPEVTPLSNLLSFECTMDPSSIEAWRLEDVSDRGLGTSTGSAPAWARVGMLVAVRFAESVEWDLAIIRRIACSETGRWVIGMSRCQGPVLAARLYAGVVKHSDGRVPTANQNQDMLAYDVLVAPERTLWIQGGRYDPQWKYTLRTRSRLEVVSMNRFLERGLNFERVELGSVDAARAA